jgi:RNA polymerase sigma-70 factor (ECF subfamily)
VNQAVARLPARQRAAIALFYGDGATMNEIAEILETTPKAIEGLLARARAELAEQLRPLAEEIG